MREIVLDTETTGLDPGGGDRIVEIGCIELVNHSATGVSWHRYINPERDMPAAAEAVHGLSSGFLADKPVFASLAEEFIAFIGDARLVIHNAPFDVGFLDAELRRVGRDPIDGSKVVDTLALARRKHPTGPNSLDALCKRYRVDSTARVKHGALLDAQLLALVYVELLGGKQIAIPLGDMDRDAEAFGAVLDEVVDDRGYDPRPTPLASLLSAEELRAHEAFVNGLGEDAIWRRYHGPSASPSEKSDD